MLSSPLSFNPSPEAANGGTPCPAIVYMQRSDAGLPVLPWDNVPKSIADNLQNAFVFRLVREPNGELRCPYISAGIQKLLGLSAAALRENLSLLNTIVDAVALHEILTAARVSSRNGSQLLIDVDVHPENADARRLRLSATPRNLRGGFIQWDGLALDVTDQVQAKEAARLREAALLASNRDLEAYAHSVAHNLRSPLHCIDAYLELFRIGHPTMLEEQAGEILKEMQASTDRMRSMIEDMLQISRLSSGELNRQTVDLSQIAQMLAEVLQRREPGRRVEIVIPDGITVNGDPRMLAIALTNMFENAWKYTSKREHARIEFGADDCGGVQVFHVKDNGAGFDMAQSARLFGAFQRLHSTADFPGTGLGLSIVRRIIERHEGHVWAEGAVGKGATFYFTAQA